LCHGDDESKPRSNQKHQNISQTSPDGRSRALYFAGCIPAGFCSSLAGMVVRRVSYGETAAEKEAAKKKSEEGSFTEERVTLQRSEIQRIVLAGDKP
jgi:hypothetical protein